MAEAPQVTDEMVMPLDEVGSAEIADIGEQSPTVAFDPAYENRRQRIFDHRVEAQADPNTMTACLAGVNSDLLDFELNIGEALRQGLATAGTSLEEIDRHSPLIDLVLRLAKQIAQITQLEQRSRRDAGDPTQPKPR